MSEPPPPMSRNLRTARESIRMDYLDLVVPAQHIAVLSNDEEALQTAIRNGANVNAVHCGTTPLFLACSDRDKEEIIRILLDAGADPRWTCECCYGTSPIVLAFSKGYLSIVEILLNHDNSLLEHSDNNDGRTLLFSAISGSQVDVVRFLINRGANVHATDERGMTPLLHACITWNVEIVQMLLAAGAEMEARNPSSQTALYYAVCHGNIEIMRHMILRHNANMFAVDSNGKTPFDVAAASAANLLLQMYGIKMTQEHGRLALHAILCAAEYSFVERRGFHPPLNPVQIILPLGKLTLNHFRTLLHSLDTDVMIRNQEHNGKLPIHIACQTNAPVEVLASLSELDPATLQIADHSGTLPLHECCRGNVDSYSSVRYLVDQGGVGTLVARDHQGALPLHVLCGSTNPSLRNVQYLIESYPASVETLTDAGQYPLMIAACETASASLSVVYELIRASPNLVFPG